MAKKTKIDIEINAKGGSELKKTTEQTDKHAKSLERQEKASKRARKADVASYNHEKQAILQTAPDAKTTNLLEMKPLGEASAVSSKPHIPSVSASAVLGESESLPESTPKCRGLILTRCRQRICYRA